jgi:hypothetical protein
MWNARRDDAPSTPWTPLRVPEALDPRGSRSAISYRLRFSLPRGLRRDRHAFLIFRKAGHRVGVTLNGTTVGEHYGIRLPFSFDVTDFLRDGAENELVVSAHAADVAHARPGGVGSADEAKAYDIFLVAPPGGWYPPGVFGDVVLSLFPALRVDDTFIRTSFRHRTIEVAAEITNLSRTAAKVSVRMEVLALDGSPTRVRLPTEVVAVPPRGRGKVERSAPFPDALAWPDGGNGTPPLYVLRTTLLVDRLPMDVVTQRFAFREVWIEDGDVLLNGKKLVVVANSVSFLAERERLAHLFDAFRSAGVNLVDLHWDDASDSFYDLADEAGMLVMPELYCSGPPHRTWPVIAGPSWADDMGRDYEAWVKLRRNHPSVVLWSPYDLGPTSGATRGDFKSFDDRVASADPTRPILGRDVFKTSIGSVHSFLRDPSDFHRRMYDNLVARAKVEHRPAMVREIADLFSIASRDVRPLFERFRDDAVDGYGGVQLEKYLLTRHWFGVNWPSVSGPDGRPWPEGGIALDVVNWSDSSSPSFILNRAGRFLRHTTRNILGNTAAPSHFIRSPEVLVFAPAECGGRGYAFAAPVSGAGAIERGTLLDPAGRGWLVLTEPGTYRVWLACGAHRETTVAVMGRPFSPEPGYAHLQEVRLDR